jgi:conjugal transfer pilus assembly protein TraF
MRLFCTYLLLAICSFSNAATQVDDGSAKVKPQLTQQSKSTTSNYFHDRERGWFWYEDPKELEQKEEKKSEKVTSSPSPAAPAMSPREILKKQGEDWEDSLATAILHPSKENYRQYLAKTAQIQQQSHDFSTGFKQAIWVSPEYDYTLSKPRDTQAIVAQNQENFRLDENELYRLSQKNGLIFFFRSDCPYCHRFAPVLKKFSEQYGFTIIPVSLDGVGLPEYPYPKKNYDLGRKLNVSVVPAVFMVNPDSNSVSTVGYGYADWTKLTKKVLFAAQQLEGTAALKVGDVR